jgi:hypothetical protein
MAAAPLPGVTKSFTLNPNTPTPLGAARPNPAGRIYMLIINNDSQNYIAWAHNTGNRATAQHHQIAPGGYYEFRWKPPAGIPLPQAGWGLTGDISAIAVSGNPSISYTEL